MTKALELYRDLKTRHEELRGRVRKSLDQADRGDVAPSTWGRSRRLCAVLVSAA